MARLPTCVCLACGHGYEPDARNDHHQKYCTRKRCIGRRRRDRQRLWHRERYASDESFRERAKSRVRRHRKRASEDRAQPPPSAAEVRLRHMEEALLGLAMQMGEESDVIRARELVSSWAETGSRRGVAMPSGP